MAKTSKKPQILLPTEDEWARFVGALDIVLKSPPQHKTAKKKAKKK